MVMVVTRLHIGGLTPNITSEHIIDRFQTFGEVRGVEDLQLDAVGQSRPFTFLTLVSSPEQLRRCVNVMSGSTWRGCHLRLAEAKLRYDERLTAERSPGPETVKAEIRRKRRRLTIRHNAGESGKQAQDMRLVTAKKLNHRKFWRLDETGHLIRPLYMVPSHPLIGVSKPSDPGVKRRLPVVRSRRRVIDPSAWRPVHLAEQDLNTDPADWRANLGQWSFEEVGHSAEDTGDSSLGVWRRTIHGTVVEEAVVKSRRWQTSPPLDDRESQEMDAKIRDRAASPLFPNRQVSGDDTSEISAPNSPLFPHRIPSREESPLSGDIPAHSTSKEQHQSEASLSNADSADPPLSSPTQPDAEVADVFDRERVVALNVLNRLFDQGKDTYRSPLTPNDVSSPFDDEESVEMPRTQATGVQDRSTELHPRNHLSGPELSLASALGDADQPSAASHDSDGSEKAPSDSEDSEESTDAQDEEDHQDEAGGVDSSEEVESGGSEDLSGESSSDGDDDDSDDSDEDGGDDRSDSDDDDDSEEDDESDSNSDDDKQGESANQPTTVDVPDQALHPGPTSLKSMFTPSASSGQGFSLLSTLDPDIELDDLDLPLPDTHHEPAPHPDLAPLALTKKALFDPDETLPLFFTPPVYPAAPTVQAHANGQAGPPHKRGRWGVDHSQNPTSVQGFWAPETDDQMREIWERDKVALTREWKARSRDARKQQRRRRGAPQLDD